MLHLKHQLCSFYGFAVIIIANHLIRMVLIDLIILYLGQAGTHYLNRNDRCKRQKKIRPTFPTFDATSIGVIMKKLKKKHAERLLFKRLIFGSSRVALMGRFFSLDSLPKLIYSAKMFFIKNFASN